MQPETTLKIRRYKSTDKDSLVALWRYVFPDDPTHNEPAKVLADKLAVDDLVLVAEQQEQIIGACMVGYDGHRGWLYAVAVLPEHRRGKAGTGLVEAAIAELRKLGCVKVNLQIRATNFEVEDFYKTLGFVSEDRISMGKLL